MLIATSVGQRVSDDEHRSRWVAPSLRTRPPVVGATIGHVDRDEPHVPRSVSARASSLNLADLLTDQARATMSVDPGDESAVRLLISSVRIAPSLINPYAALADWLRAGGEDPYGALREIWETHGADDQRALRFVEQHRAGDPSAIVAGWCDGRRRAEVLVHVADDLSYLDIYDADGVGGRPLQRHQGDRVPRLRSRPARGRARRCRDRAVQLAGRSAMRDCLQRSPWVPVALGPARRVPLDLREVLRDPVWMQTLRRTTNGLEETLDDTSYLHWHGLHVFALCHQQDRSLIAELQEHCKRVTAPYKYPRIVEFADELPKTSSGKIKRAELRGGP